MMKRLGQLFLSVLFVITVSSIYFAFDIAVTNMTKPKRYSIDKHNNHQIQRTTTLLSLIQPKSLEKISNNHRVNVVKRKIHPRKSAQFHKSRTGVKINAKGQQKLLQRTENKINVHKSLI